MRLIYTLHDPKKAQQFSEFLRREGVPNECDVVTNTDWGSPDYGTVKCTIWVIEEDQTPLAQKWAEEFEKDPNNPLFTGEHLLTSLPNSKETKQEPIKRLLRKSSKRVTTPGLGPATLYLLITCTLLFLLGEITTPSIKLPLSPLPLTPLYSPPINKGLFYDYPAAYEIIDRLTKAYGIEKLSNLEDLPPEGKLLVQQYEQTPYWKGIYDKLVGYLSTPSVPIQIDAPLFEKIRKGEYWRLFTPAMLHQNIFHLFFNLVWLLILGRLMEERLGTVRYIVFILIAAIISNTAQYLVGGANFIGISGVICAMLGFIYARQTKAPWEGYSLGAGVLSFMFFFIVAMVALQSFSFLMEIYWKESFVPGIANTAHVVGALTGYVLGQLSSFAVKR